MLGFFLPNPDSMKSNRIPAVYKEELESLLTSIGELEFIRLGVRVCQVCAKVITVDNLQLLIPKQGHTFDYVCNDHDCVSSFNSNKK